MIKWIWHRFLHLFGRHRYEYIQRLSRDSHKLKCGICQKNFCMNTNVKVVVDWDLELEDFFK